MSRFYEDADDGYWEGFNDGRDEERELLYRSFDEAVGWPEDVPPTIENIVEEWNKIQMELETLRGS